MVLEYFFLVKIYGFCYTLLGSDTMEYSPKKMNEILEKNNFNFKKKFGIELEKAYNIEPLLKSKELIKKKGNLYINPIYIYVSNEILLKII